MHTGFGLGRIAAGTAFAAALALVSGCSSQAPPEPAPPPARIAEPPSPEDLAGAPPTADQSGLLGGPVASGGPLPPARAGQPAYAGRLMTYRREDGRLVTSGRPVPNPTGARVHDVVGGPVAAAAPSHHRRHHRGPGPHRGGQVAHRHGQGGHHRPVIAAPHATPPVAAHKAAPSPALARPAVHPAAAKPAAQPPTATLKTKPLAEPKTVQSIKPAAPPANSPKLATPSQLKPTDAAPATQAEITPAAPAPAPTASAWLDRLGLGSDATVDVPGVGKVSSKSLIGGGLVLLAMIILVLLARRVGENERREARRRKFRTMTDYGTGPLTHEENVPAPEDFASDATTYRAPPPQDVIVTPPPVRETAPPEETHQAQGDTPREPERV